MQTTQTTIQWTVDCMWMRRWLCGGKVMRLISGSLTQFKANANGNHKSNLQLLKWICNDKEFELETKSKTKFLNWSNDSAALAKGDKVQGLQLLLTLLNLFSFVCNSAKKEAANKCTERQKKQTNLSKNKKPKLMPEICWRCDAAIRTTIRLLQFVQSSCPWLLLYSMWSDWVVCGQRRMLNHIDL